MYRSPMRSLARLRSRRRLEGAMRSRDVNANELAHLAGVHRQSISKLRRGEAHRMKAESAYAIEKALRVERGHLFDYADEPASVTSLAESAS